jgi:hypothetical protein
MRTGHGVGWHVQGGTTSSRLANVPSGSDDFQYPNGKTELGRVKGAFRTPLAARADSSVCAARATTSERTYKKKPIPGAGMGLRRQMNGYGTRIAR